MSARLCFDIAKQAMETEKYLKLAYSWLQETLKRNTEEQDKESYENETDPLNEIEILIVIAEVMVKLGDFSGASDYISKEMQKEENKDFKMELMEVADMFKNKSTVQVDYDNELEVIINSNVK